MRQAWMLVARMAWAPMVSSLTGKLNGQMGMAK